MIYLAMTFQFPVNSSLLVTINSRSSSWGVISENRVLFVKLLQESQRKSRVGN